MKRIDQRLVCVGFTKKRSGLLLLDKVGNFVPLVIVQATERSEFVSITLYWGSIWPELEMLLAELRGHSYRFADNLSHSEFLYSEIPLIASIHEDTEYVEHSIVDLISGTKEEFVRRVCSVDYVREKEEAEVKVGAGYPEKLVAIDLLNKGAETANKTLCQIVEDYKYPHDLEFASKLLENTNTQGTPHA